MSVDFTSALYLGFRHRHQSLRPWHRLTTGKPAALETQAEHVAAAQTVARLLGCEGGVLATSTIHLFWDLFLSLADRKTLICLDEGAYSIVKWGVERAACRGIRVAVFRHYDAHSLADIIQRESKGLRPLVVADGVCPACGVTVPLLSFLEIVRRYNGLLVLDDTQGIGLMGEAPDRLNPYGKGGGGTLRRHGIMGNDILVASSLAKGFGAPVAILAGAKGIIQRYEEGSETRMHCNPPSTAVVSAAERALLLNRSEGDLLRQRLAALVSQFRRGIAAMGLSTTGNSFPVQTLIPQRRLNLPAIHAGLMWSGIRTVLQKSKRGTASGLSFIITADKRIEDIDNALEALALAMHHKQHASLHDKEVDYDFSLQRTT